MAILCNFKQNGIEGSSQWRVVASCLNGLSWFEAFESQYFSHFVNQQLPQIKGVIYAK